jgi:hypothetical protein
MEAIEFLQRYDTTSFAHRRLCAVARRYALLARPAGKEFCVGRLMAPRL